MSTALRIAPLFFVALVFAKTAAAEEAAQSASNAIELTTEIQQFSYAVGANAGQQLQNLKSELDIQALKQGLEDALNGKTLKLSDKARQDVMIAVAQKVQQKKMEERRQLGEKNKLEGENFLASNRRRSGVKTTTSGLQYEVVRKGNGATPTEADSVTVQYKGTLIDGTVFDSSYERGAPTSFTVNNVVPGWREGLMLMKAHGKYKLYVPANLAYGEQGAEPKIGPNTTLIFEVELMDVKSAAHEDDENQEAAERDRE